MGRQPHRQPARVGVAVVSERCRHDVADDNLDVRFKPRLLEGVRLPIPIEPEFMLLDGQQRTTSLYQALRSGGPVNTRDMRKKEMSRCYFADICGCIDPHGEREEAIRSFPADRIDRKFRGDVVLDVSIQDAQIAGQMFPLGIVLDVPATARWQLAYLQGGAMSERLATWIAFNEAVVAPFMQYSVPTIELTRGTPKKAVGQVFDKYAPASFTDRLRAADRNVHRGRREPAGRLGPTRRRVRRARLRACRSAPRPFSMSSSCSPQSRTSNNSNR